jgi:tetratricopeptide (TPR) repeat protein
VWVKKTFRRKEKMCKRSGLIALSIFIVLITLAAFAVYFIKKGQEQKYANDKCWLYINKGSYEKAIEYVNSLNNKHPSIYACIGTAYYNTGNLQLALENFKKAEEIQEDILHRYYSPKLDIYIYTHIAKILTDVKKYDDAIGYYNKALRKMKNRRKIKDKNSYANILIEIAKIYKEKGNMDKAIEYYQKAFKLKQKINELEQIKAKDKNNTISDKVS